MADTTTPVVTPTEVMKPTAITRANPSPELEAQAADVVNRLNQLSTGLQEAYSGKQDTYTDVIRGLTNLYGAKAGPTASAAGSAALGSGLTPLEATQTSQNTLEQFMQQLFPQVAGLKAEQADVPIAYQDAMRGVGQDYQSLLSNVMAPYYRDLAGTEQYDILGREQLAETSRQFSVEQQRLERELQSNREMFYAGMKSEREMFDIETQLKQQQMQLEQQLTMAQLNNAMNIARMQESGATNRASIAAQSASDRLSISESGANTRSDKALAAQVSESATNREFTRSQTLLEGAIRNLSQSRTIEAGASEGALNRTSLENRTATTAGARSPGQTPEDRERLARLQAALRQQGDLSGDIGAVRSAFPDAVNRSWWPFHIGDTINQQTLREGIEGSTGFITPPSVPPPVQDSSRSLDQTANRTNRVPALVSGDFDPAEAEAAFQRIMLNR